jgi:hypothetical protein
MNHLYETRRIGLTAKKKKVVYDKCVWSVIKLVIFFCTQFLLMKILIVLKSLDTASYFYTVVAFVNQYNIYAIDIFIVNPNSKLHFLTSSGLLNIVKE